MKRWLSFFYRNREVPKASHYHEVMEKLHKLEQQLQSLTDRKNEVYITIEQMHVDQPTLENLTFRLDRLDIDELSGALNLGNNFNTSVQPKKKTEPLSGESAKSNNAGPFKESITKQEEKESGTTEEKTRKGYSYRFNKQ